MDTLKTKAGKSNHVVFNLISYLCTSSTARYRILINKMCLWIYCCGMAAHIWWI